VYTLWLKRRTWHNIVIGGAAGAFPPLVGYAAVTGELSPLAWFLFALIFTWTPVHFWALALLIKEDYAKAGVPMLPVVKGEQVTVVQITLYAVITTLLCFLPVVQREAGLVYLLGSVILNAGLLAQSAALMRNTSREKARSLFKFSMVYLALIFVVIAVDRVWTA
jgi:protoheme IX farnesyltransferase